MIRIVNGWRAANMNALNCSMDFNGEEPMVSIVCTAYNHENYISKALDSFLMQHTNFPFEIIVNDDASTDKTAEIIKSYMAQYPDLIKGIFHEENQHNKGIKAGVFCVRRARGKYIAVCEGDDFWTDSNKLQKQVDFMEAHPDYSLCVHSGYYAIENGDLDNKKLFRRFCESKTVTMPEILEGWSFPTASFLYKNNGEKYAFAPYQGDCPNGDFALITYQATQGKIYYIDEPMCAYRFQSIGSWNYQMRKNPERMRQATLKFVDMLERFDAFSSAAYHDSVESLRNKKMFSYWMSFPNLKKAKEYPELYKNITATTIIKNFSKNHFPTLWVFLYRFLIKFKICR